ncbi:hypothetical protein BGX33_001501, partial [Mortierella sp. NVP41]
MTLVIVQLTIAASPIADGVYKLQFTYTSGGAGWRFLSINETPHYCSVEPEHFRRHQRWNVINVEDDKVLLQNDDTKEYLDIRKLEDRNGRCYRIDIVPKTVQQQSEAQRWSLTPGDEADQYYIELPYPVTVEGKNYQHPI